MFMREKLPILLTILFLPGAVSAARLERKDVPQPLKPWVEWALHGQENKTCPFLQGNVNSRQCAWPSKISLTLGARSGRFTQKWRVFGKEAWVTLPGDKKIFPQTVTVNGKSAPVILRSGRPTLRLGKGAHTVAGSFAWKELPQLLQVPPQTGLLSLSVDGKIVAFPVRDTQGRLWVRKRQRQGSGKSEMSIIVHRRIVDEIPLELQTQIQLRVSGKTREELLGIALPKGFVPMAISGPLPARVEKDGRLRVQVRPGNWTISLRARQEGSLNSITLEDADGPWDDEEAWVFESRNHLRLVDVKGAPSIDPQQTQMPAGWRGFPAYVMRPGSTLKFEERRRGNADPQPDRLKLSRAFWLDYDGKGMTIQDSMSGELHRSWRLEMDPRTELGRAAIGGRDQFITSLGENGSAGFEIRQGQVNLVADSRIENRSGNIPAVGWNHDFEHVSAQLNLPPGWSLIHAFGVDDASRTWIKRWTLLDIFLVLIIAVAVSKLWGNPWGAAALVTTVLCWHEPKALKWSWLFVIALEAVWRALPEGKFKTGVKIGRAFGWGCLALFAIAFMSSEIKGGLYPQLDRHYGSGRNFISRSRAVAGIGGESKTVTLNAVMGNARETDSFADEQKERALKTQFLLPGVPKQKDITQPRRRSYAQKSRQMIYYDPKAMVNTGPGLPNWSWNTISLSWRGPVQKDQEIRFVLISPNVNKLLAFVRSGLVVCLALLFFGLPVADWLRQLKSGTGFGKFRKWLFPALLLFAIPSASAQTFEPSDKILNQLRDRLLENPKCAPHCVEIPRMRLSATAKTLTLRLEVSAQAETAFQLPGDLGQWSPKTVVLNGNAATLRRNSAGTLWLRITRGTHQLVLQGPLPDRESVSIPLPLRPRRVEYTVSGWLLAGVAPNGSADANIQLSREQRATGKKDSLEPGKMPPFVRIERTIQLGLSWTATTRVTRMTPADSSIVLEIPLLPGESVNTESVRVKDGKALLSLSPKTQSGQWTSSLKEMPSLLLKASEDVPWVEQWSLYVDPLWHAEVSGIPTVHPRSAVRQRGRVWRPWPGETVIVTVTRPKGVEGQTLTIDSANLALSPGIRATDATLSLSLRSSRGGQHSITLPDGADLQSVAIDGVLQPVREENGKVVLPIRPGSHSATLKWRESRGITLSYSTSKVDLGVPSVNPIIRVNMPRDRWTLLLCGPRLGPAVLFWPLLLIFLMISIALGRVSLTPLSWKQWFLLSLGLTQVPMIVFGIIAGWLLWLGWRGKNPPEDVRSFDVQQVFLAGLTVLALMCLFHAITQGLLGAPDMQISGNASNGSLFKWYQDRTGSLFPQAWIFSAPRWVYRAAMLAWALWLASSLIVWLKWGWSCYAEGGLWKQSPVKEPTPPPPPEKKNKKS